jgi:hypothetical protein
LQSPATYASGTSGADAGSCGAGRSAGISTFTGGTEIICGVFGVGAAAGLRVFAGFNFVGADFAAFFPVAGLAVAAFFARRFRRVRAASSFFSFSTALRAFLAAFLASLYFCFALFSASLPSFALFFAEPACLSAT